MEPPTAETVSGPGVGGGGGQAMEHLPTPPLLWPTVCAEQQGPRSALPVGCGLPSVSPPALSLCFENCELSAELLGEGLSGHPPAQSRARGPPPPLPWGWLSGNHWLLDGGLRASEGSEEGVKLR